MVTSWPRLNRGNGRGRGLAAAPIVASGLLADYRFDVLSGTAVHDYSGNGYDGAFAAGANAPTWAAAGLSFGGDHWVDFATLPFASVVTVQLLASYTYADNFASMGLYGGTANTAGVRDVCAFLQGILPTPNANPQPCTGYNVSRTTTGYDGMFPSTVFTWVIDASADKIYYDGSEASNYANRTGLSGLGRAGTFRLGASALTDAFAFPKLSGTVHRLAIYSRQLTPSEITSNATAIHATATARGAAAKFLNPSTTRLLVCDGDSITAGSGVATPWPTGMTLVRSYTRYNWGIGGQTAQAIAAYTPVRIAPLLRGPSAPVCVYVLMAGTNDVTLNGRTPAQVFADLQTAVNNVLADATDGVNIRAVVLPMISRTGQDSAKNVLNGLIAGGTWGSRVTLVAPASLPHLCPDGSSANATWFQDGVHPTQAGADEIGAAVAAAVDALG